MGSLVRIFFELQHFTALAKQQHCDGISWLLDVATATSALGLSWLPTMYNMPVYYICLRVWHNPAVGEVSVFQAWRAKKKGDGHHQTWDKLCEQSKPLSLKAHHCCSVIILESSWSSVQNGQLPVTHSPTLVPSTSLFKPTQDLVVPRLNDTNDGCL